MARDLIAAECQAVSRFFSTIVAGGQQCSAIFDDSVISPDGVPAGVFIMSVGKQFVDRPADPHILLPQCVLVLCHVSSSVIDAILLPMPCSTDGSICDPRCSIAEAWFTSLAAMAKSPVAHLRSDHANQNRLLTETVVAAVVLMFSPKLGKEDSRSNVGHGGMSLDGPQSLAMMDFLSAFLALGSESLGLAVEELARRFPIDVIGCCSPGLVVLLTALFRAVQGSLPPWIVESIPVVFSNLFCCGLNKNFAVFADALRASMVFRIPSSSPAPLRGVEPGQLLSGYAFDALQDESKENFVQQVLDLAKTDTHASWKRLKHCVKAACGGKKKDTDFRQKPSPTLWEFERI